MKSGYKIEISFRIYIHLYTQNCFKAYVPSMFKRFINDMFSKHFALKAITTKTN